MTKANPGIDLGVEIKTHKVDQNLLLEFVKYVHQESKGQTKTPISLLEYIRENFYKGENIMIIPDLSGQEFGKKVSYESKIPEHDKEALIEKNKIFTKFKQMREEKILDLSSIDFTGSDLTGATFIGCKLDNAVLRDSDLNGVYFDDCSLVNADLRGADLSHCKLGEGDTVDFFTKNLSPDSNILSSQELEQIGKMLVADRIERYQGMYFSSTESMFYQYQDKNREITKLAEKEFYKKKKKIFQKKKKKKIR